MRITDAFLKSLLELLEKEYLHYSKFSNKNVLQKFLDNNGVSLINETPKLVVLNSRKTVFQTLKEFGRTINSTEELKAVIEQKDTKNRIDNLEYDEHTKVKESKSFEGLTFSSFQDIPIILDGKSTIFSKTQYGSGTFSHSSIQVEIPKDIILVGVENPQVVWFIERFQKLFHDKQYIFLNLTQYGNKYQYEWLESFTGEYLHFGDFDLAGINIYQNSIVPKLKNSKSYSFFIPKNLYTFMKEKNYKKDFSNQLKFLEIRSEDKNLQELIDFIKYNKITLEQEMLVDYLD